MLNRFRFALLGPMALLSACTLPSSTSNTPQPLTGTWQNWQIQAGTVITSPPNTSPSFLGAIQTQSSQASAIFTSPTVTGTQVLDFTGTYNSATGYVMLQPSASGSTYVITFTMPPIPDTVVSVNVTGVCGWPPVCNVELYIPSVGVQIAPLTGTYVGTLAGSSIPAMSGTATLTLTQSSSPDTAGEFPLSGTIVLPAGLGSFPVTGTVLGEGFTLNYCSTAVSGPCFSLTASTNPTATQITVSNITYNDQFGRSATYTGTLIRQ